MASVFTGTFGAPRPEPMADPDVLARLDFIATLLDSAFVIPGTGRTIGLDGLLRLLPGAGDALSTVLSAYIVWEARRLGLPIPKLAQMVGNIALDTLVGATPFAGTLFDVFYKANRRNLRILQEHLGHKRAPRTIEGEAVRVESPAR
jgi:Domain of unknown function (DUF4112)